MKWSRREFLRAMLAGVAASVAPALPVAASVKGSLASVLSGRFEILDILVTTSWEEAILPETTSWASFELQRPSGALLMQCPMPRNRGATFRWVAAPGEALVCMDGAGDVVNVSDKDLDVSFVIRKDDELFYIDKDGKVQPMSSLPTCEDCDNEEELE